MPKTATHAIDRENAINQAIALQRLTMLVLETNAQENDDERTEFLLGLQQLTETTADRLRSVRS